jgi:hypothetical protein
LVTSVHRPVAVGVADLNHDGKVDLAVTHEPTSNTGISCHPPGRRSGRFRPAY